MFQIEDYIQDDKDLPLLLVGEAGCGKSSVLCKLADDLWSRLKKGDLKRYHLAKHRPKIQHELLLFSKLRSTIEVSSHFKEFYCF